MKQLSRRNKKKKSNDYLKKMTLKSLNKSTQRYKFFHYELNIILRVLFLLKDIVNLFLSAIIVFIFRVGFVQIVLLYLSDIYFVLFVI